MEREGRVTGARCPAALRREIPKIRSHAVAQAQNVMCVPSWMLLQKTMDLTLIIQHSNIIDVIMMYTVVLLLKYYEYYDV